MIILNDLQGHSPISTIVNCDFSYSCAAVDKMSTDIAEFLVNVWGRKWLRLPEFSESAEASIIQGSAVGPASYVANAGDLTSMMSGNELYEYADDRPTYIVVPAVNICSREAELENIEKLAARNNLEINRKKSLEISFTESRRRCTCSLSTASAYRHPACDVNENTGHHSDKSSVSKWTGAGCHMSLRAINARTQSTAESWTAHWKPSNDFQGGCRRKVDIRVTCLVGLHNCRR